MADVEVRTEVLDPGEREGVHATYPCVVNPKSHTWFPVSIREMESTWYCSVCRRVERRYLETVAVAARDIPLW